MRRRRTALTLVTIATFQLVPIHLKPILAKDQSGMASVYSTGKRKQNGKRGKIKSLSTYCRTSHAAAGQQG